MEPELPAFPRTPACAGAREVAEKYCSVALLNHCLRSYLWAAAHGSREGVPYDPELLYVGALLHDIGLVTEFDSHALGFDDVSGHVAYVFSAGAGWPEARRAQLVDVVLSHTWDVVDVDVHPEGFLLERSTSMDISGRYMDDFSAGFKAGVLDLLPRAGIAKEFLACFRDQADRKPASSPARALRDGLADGILGNALDR
ncbi:cyanamide hydratase [Actinophytocola xinjiangensis]|uniref:Cyanamide hydratase n=1 Tax=Actinophytocola xinjiangensis TaxID=485602 RepID=A0A7Z0WMI6_9PSEU|nr:HD domain-containing protein [Actinophytocola xinjiangensis]OLF10537.1 cyanamide hydratase [Actinophytocola xinjiangensis]